MKTVKVVVKNEFTDRYTGLKHKPGEKLDVTEARYREIQRSGDYVAVDKPAATETNKERK